MIALSDEAYSQASQGSILDELLFKEKHILREGEILKARTNDVDGKPLMYQLEMLEPINQGYAEHQTTKVILLVSDDTSHALESTTDSPSVPELEEEDESQEFIEIDEDFLAHSVLSQGLVNTAGSFSVSSSDSARMSSTYTCRELAAPVSTVDDSCTLYVRTASLGKTGIQSGDWVG